MQDFKNPPQFSATDAKLDTTVDICAENALESSIRVTLTRLWYNLSRYPKLLSDLITKYCGPYKSGDHPPLSKNIVSQECDKGRKVGTPE